MAATTKVINFGVTQKLNFGSTLFAIYVYDIFNIFDFALVLYGDDTSLFVYLSEFEEKKS